MIRFQRILFPVDFSKQDEEAAPFVKAIAERFHSELTLLHVAQFLPLGYRTPDAVILKSMPNSS
jgi:nucleotide-binding universal stress UspA family protein